MQILAHRGSKGTQPENTLVAFEEAVKVHADGIELDVHLSKDNQLIVIHDETIDRTTNGIGFVKDMTLPEIKSYNALANFKEREDKAEIPTLSEVLELLENLKFEGLLNIEIKTDSFEYPGIEKELSELIDKNHWNFPIVFSSFNLDTLKRMNKMNNKHLIYWIMEGSKEQVILAEKLDFIKGIHPNIEFLKKEYSLWKGFKKLIRPWTVNTEQEMQFCIQHNLEGFHTDFPEKALTYVNEKKIH